MVLHVWGRKTASSHIFMLFFSLPKVKFNFQRPLKKSGIVPNFTSIFDSTLLSIGFQDFMYMLYDNIKLVEHIMDIILE